MNQNNRVPTSSHPEEVDKMGFTAVMDKLMNFAKSLRKDKFGLAGLLIVIGLSVFAVSGIIYKGEQGIYAGTGPKYAAPIWLAPFDDAAFKYDETLIQTNFRSQESIGPAFPQRTQTIPESIGFEKVPADKGMNLKFFDKVPTQNLTETPTASITYAKTVQWDKKAPNGIDLDFSFKFNVSGGLNANDIFGDNAPYQPTVTLYFAPGRPGMSVEGMIQYINQRQGANYIQPKHYDQHGIHFLSPLRPDGSLTTKKPSKNLPRRKNIVLFDLLDQIELKLKIDFTIAEPFPEKRSEGDILVNLQTFAFKARGYYSGPMGTTDVGSDLYSLIAQGLKNSLMVGLAATAVTLAIGISLGLMAGWYGGKIEEFIMRVVDFLLVLPGLPLMLVLVSIFDEMAVSRVWGVVMTLSFIYWAGITRLIRSQVISVKERPFIEAAQASGATDFRIMFGHILKNVIGLVIYQVVLSVQGAVLATAALSFLGKGPRWVSFGNILQRVSGVLLGIGEGGSGGNVVGPGGEVQTGAEAVLSAWWYIVFPGLILFLFGTGLIFLGMSLQNRVQRGGRES